MRRDEQMVERAPRARRECRTRPLRDVDTHPPLVARLQFRAPRLVGATPFWLAARFSEPDVMRLLVKHGADPLFVHHATM